MPRPRTVWFSSRTTALVVVEPRSMPMKQRISKSFSVCGQRRRALLLDHLEVALETVLHVRRGEVARIDEVRLDERGGLAGALLHFAQDEKLARGKAVAALDRV